MFNFKDNDISLNVAILLALLAPSVVFFQAFTANSLPDASATSMSQDKIAERIQPVVKLDNILGEEGGQQTGGAAVVAKTPEALYQGACFACHTTGVANAPKLGNKADWEPRAALGMDELLKIAISGKGAMPPKGGSAYTDEEIHSVIEYMLSKAGLSVN